MGRTERKEQILESAARLFASRRFDEVLMEDIAQEAGVAKGTLYTYFPAKEELYFAVVFDGLSRLNDQLEHQALGDVPPERKLRDVMYALISFLQQNRFFFRLMSIEDGKSEGGRGEYRGRWHAQRRRQKEALEAVLRSGMESGVFQIAHLSTEARILRGMVRSVLHHHGEQLSVDEMVDTVLRIFLHGVRTRG